MNTTLDRKFEKYIGGPTVDPLVRVHITLSPTGRIILSRAAYKHMGSPEAVYLYFSRADDEIAIQPTRLNMPEALPVHHTHSGHRVNAAPFCRHFRIKLTSTEKFVAPQFTNAGVILSLRRTVTVTHTNKGTKRKKKD